MYYKEYVPLWSKSNINLLYHLITRLTMPSKPSSSHQTHTLFVIDHFHPYIGWGEVLFWSLTKSLIGQWERVTVLTSRFESNLKDRENIDGVEVIRVGGGRWSFLVQSLITGRTICRTNKIDYIHTSSCFGMRSTLFLSAYFHITSRITIHEVYGLLWIKLFGWRRWLWRLLGEKISLSLCHFDEYQCVSLYTLNSLRLMSLIPDAKLKLAKNKIDKTFRDRRHCSLQDQEYLKKKYDIIWKKIWLFFGRLGYIKWLDRILKSLPEIIDKNPEFRLVIIAPQDSSLYNLLPPRYRSFVVRLNLVTQEELRNWIWLSDVCILPSKAEWFGYAIAEAASMGASIVTTRIGAIPEVLEGYEKVRYIDGSWKLPVDWFEEM